MNLSLLFLVLTLFSATQAASERGDLAKVGDKGYNHLGSSNCRTFSRALEKRSRVAKNEKKTAAQLASIVMINCGPSASEVLPSPLALFGNTFKDSTMHYKCLLALVEYSNVVGYLPSLQKKLLHVSVSKLDYERYLELLIRIKEIGMYTLQTVTIGPDFPVLAFTQVIEMLATIGIKHVVFLSFYRTHAFYTLIETVEIATPLQNNIQAATYLLKRLPLLDSLTLNLLDRKRYAPKIGVFLRTLMDHTSLSTLILVGDDILLVNNVIRNTFTSLKHLHLKSMTSLEVLALPSTIEFDTLTITAPSSILLSTALTANLKSIATNTKIIIDTDSWSEKLFHFKQTIGPIKISAKVSTLAHFKELGSTFNTNIRYTNLVDTLGMLRIGNIKQLTIHFQSSKFDDVLLADIAIVFEAISRTRIEEFTFTLDLSCEESSRTSIIEAYKKIFDNVSKLFDVRKGIKVNGYTYETFKSIKGDLVIDDEYVHLEEFDSASQTSRSDRDARSVSASVSARSSLSLLESLKSSVKLFKFEMDDSVSEFGYRKYTAAVVNWKDVLVGVYEGSGEVEDEVSGDGEKIDEEDIFDLDI